MKWLLKYVRRFWLEMLCTYRGHGHEELTGRTVIECEGLLVPVRHLRYPLCGDTWEEYVWCAARHKSDSQAFREMASDLLATEGQAVPLPTAMRWSHYPRAL